MNICFTQNQLNISSFAYQQILNNSLVSKGNNFRLKNTINKIKQGEKVNIAIIGGSVTEGAGPKDFRDGYAYQFFYQLREKFAPKNSNNLYLNNAGLEGTPSTLGKLRYDEDIENVFGTQPDILIIEFAVNDGGEEIYNRSFESLVRNALLKNPKTAVIALYSAATYGNSAFQKKKVSDYYDIAQIDVLKSIKPAILNNILKQENFYTDSVHPTKEGHKIMADCLINLFVKIDKSSFDDRIQIPENPIYKNSLDNLQRIYDDSKNVKILKGSFNQIDKNCQIFNKNKKSVFPKNWYKSSNSSNESLKIEITCKTFLISYKIQGSWMTEKFGSADFFVDGKKNTTKNGFNQNGWNNTETFFLIDEKNPSKHFIEIKMSEGNENKGFTILAMGYN